MSIRPLFVVAGVGNAAGTGAAAARAFSKAGYSVALIARRADSLKSLAEEINSSGGDAIPVPVPSYTPTALSTAFASIKSHSSPNAKYEIRAALFNTGHGVWKPFLDVTPADIQESLDTNISAGFAFAREVILAFKQNDIVIEGDEASHARGKRGTLIFTGATASLRGNTTTSVFAAGKFGLRALSQSLAKEFGKDNIHVAHAIIDGGILTDRSRERRSDPKWEANEDVRLSPESIAQAYLFLANQERSAWTWELDLRPAHEKW